MENSIKSMPYKEEVLRYGKKSALFAIIYAVYISILGVAFLFVNSLDFINLRDNDGNLTLLGDTMTLIILVPLSLIPLLLLVKKKGAGFRSIGLHFDNYKEVILYGIFMLAVLFMLADGFLPGILANWQLQSLHLMAFFIVATLLRAFWEDVVYIGYMQTRLYGFFKKDSHAILVGAFIFAAIHYPSFIARWFAINEGSTDWLFWAALVFRTIDLMFAHFIMNMIYRRFLSIIPVTLFHFGWNFTHSGHLWEYTGEGGLGWGISLIVSYTMVLLITVILPHVKKKRMSKSRHIPTCEM